ncbi:hypothetical protein BO85DRAFT_32464 [Aspergillus piperis CBS 112811]|uniref:Uncharacterized protein n=1 Tax=Aspergillus piperis CBS 112811 TaxID=1448313 RepID=A0A8G1R5E4_9EURO|nr:hypothetical protein BO85DRAFT_32464 [Aspergillus piperis CBS 112811]RAH57115.1 hypothetical protein BO85DRAFT_32464 [Aspergillus piperis CBS 112811]
MIPVSVFPKQVNSSILFSLSFFIFSILFYFFFIFFFIFFIFIFFLFYFIFFLGLLFPVQVTKYLQQSFPAQSIVHCRLNQ